VDRWKPGQACLPQRPQAGDFRLAGPAEGVGNGLTWRAYVFPPPRRRSQKPAGPGRNASPREGSERCGRRWRPSWGAGLSVWGLRADPAYAWRWGSSPPHIDWRVPSQRKRAFSRRGLRVLRTAQLERGLNPANVGSKRLPCGVAGGGLPAGRPGRAGAVGGSPDLVPPDDGRGQAGAVAAAEQLKPLRLPRW